MGLVCFCRKSSERVVVRYDGTRAEVRQGVTDISPAEKRHGAPRPESKFESRWPCRRPKHGGEACAQLAHDIWAEVLS